jgi:hypothetical protein
MVFKVNAGHQGRARKRGTPHLLLHILYFSETVLMAEVHSGRWGWGVFICTAFSIRCIAIISLFAIRCMTPDIR